MLLEEITTNWETFAAVENKYLASDARDFIINIEMNKNRSF